MTFGPAATRGLLATLGAVAVLIATPQSQADDVAKSKVFDDMDKLVGYLAGDRALHALCTPELIASYDLFQNTVEERISTLLYLQDAENKLGLSPRTVRRVNECIKILEDYVDNQERWEALAK